MKLYLHLSESGLTIDDLSIRVYDGGELSPLTGEDFTLTALSNSTSYELDDLPEAEDSSGDGWTITLETPPGVYHAYRWGNADSKPSQLIIPIRESGHTLSSLAVKVFRDGVEFTDLDPLDELSSPGDYNLTGWTSPTFGEQWSVKWTYSGITYSHAWTGVDPLVVAGTHYLEIISVQNPFPFAVDAKNRHMFSVNFDLLVTHPIPHFEEDIISILSSAGLATSGVDIFYGLKVSIPDGNGPYTLIKNTGGLGSEETHNGDKYRRMSMQIVVYAVVFSAGRTRIEAIWNELDGKREVTIAA